MVYDLGDSMKIRFPLLRILSRGLTLSGVLRYRYRDGMIKATGDYALEKISGSFKIEGDGKRLHFRIKSDPTKSLEPIKKLLPLSSVAQEWLLKRLKASRYHLLFLEGVGEFDSKRGRFRVQLESLHAEAKLKDISLRFNDRLKAIYASKARVVLKDKNLYFLLHSPRYGKRSINGSSAALLNIFEPKRLKLLLRLRYSGLADSYMMQILKSYSLNIPLRQRKGSLRASIDIDAPLKHGSIQMRGLVHLGSGVFEYRKKSFRVGGGVLAFTSRRLELRNIRIKEKIFQGSIGGQFDLKRKRGGFDIWVKRLMLPPSYPILSMKRTHIRGVMRWDRRQTRIDFPSLKSVLKIDSKDRVKFELKNLALLRPYLQGLAKLIDDGGSLKIVSLSSNSWKISGVLLWRSSPFYKRAGAITRLPFKAILRSNGIEIDALKGALHYSSKENLLSLEGINVDAKRLTDLLKKLKKGIGGGGRFVVLGKKSLIRYGAYVLLTDDYRLVKRKDNLDFYGRLGEDRLSLKKRGDEIKLLAEGIGDRMLHSLIHFNGIRNGRYTIHVSGSEKRGYSGELLIRGGVLRDFKTYNDLIATINAVPALMSFSNPGFSRRGFEIVNGTILFRLKDNRLQLGRILLVGKSATVVGKGYVELDTGRLDVDLAIRTAREMGRALSKIPVVGYIIFGKDKSLTAGVKIIGTLKHPVINTNPVRDALLYPLDLLRRTLNAPAHFARPHPQDTELLTTPPPAQAAPLPSSTKKRSLRSQSRSIKKVNK